ncbi:hypothetical protein NUSPORA_02044 [Nucleospora cyclopteri]
MCLIVINNYMQQEKQALKLLNKICRKAHNNNSKNQYYFQIFSNDFCYLII